MTLSKDIWIFTEYRDHEVASVTLEMLSEARKLAGELNGKTCACLIGCRVEEYIPSLQNHGAEKLYLFDDDVFSEYSLDAYAFTLQRLIERHSPLITMFGATPLGSELAPRIAARLKLPCITEVKRIKVEGENLVIAKSCYDDKVYQNFHFRPERTVVLTVLPGDMDSAETCASGEVEIVKEDIDLEPDMVRTRHMKFIKGDPRKISLEEADLIIAGGKGVAKGLPILEELADVLGASIGGTRPLVDEGIIPFERQIGITGKSVNPRLLMACGISGAREFATGIEKAKLTVAINTDRKARIFDFVDIGLLEDVNKVIPALIKKLKQRNGTE